jgi:hypothetical protein
MIKINGHCSFPRPLLAIAMTLGLLVGGTMSAQAGTVTATGANGANGACGHGGGAGGAATATTITPGDPSNDATAQGGTGGTGGNLCPPGKSFPRAGVGGSGGAATATATTKVATGSASATAIGTGGKGGTGGAGSGDFFPRGAAGGGGAATATSSAADAGAGAVTSSATANGGVGGECCSVELPGGMGGMASAVASGQSTGGGSVDVSASAFGGPGTFGGGTASASATGLALTGNVQANASASGGSESFGSGPGTAFAQSHAKNASGEVLTTASSPGGGVGTGAGVGSLSLEPADVAAGRAVSNAVLTPSGPDIGVGAMSAAYGGTGSAVTYEATATFDFSTPVAGLDLKLLSDSFADTSAGVAFDSMELLVVHGTTQIEKTFSSLTGSAGAEAYFTALPTIGLGAIAAGQSIEIEYFLGYTSGTSAAVGNGFGFTYELVDPPAPGAPIPEPSTWAMMLVGFAGLAWLGHRAARTGAAKST